MADSTQEQQLGLQFEDILPWGVTGGDTGLSSRLKLKRNFERIKLYLNMYSGSFLSRIHDDTALGLITFMKGATFGEFVEGLRGGRITAEGVAELEKIIVRNDAVFSGNLSSPDFVSGFPVGTGWALQKKEFVNAAGEIEYKYILECDGANIRGTLRIYEFIVSQMLGENDNRIITAMMEVHHYDPVTGKVWLSTNGGRTYNVFRKGDCIMVQQYQPGNDYISGGNGYIVKNYELQITDVGSGGETDENGDRLDWVKFTNFTTMMDDASPETLISQYDTFCRLDNLTDPERKGIIQFISVGTNAPYMDIHYGMKTDPDNHLKGRIGNLEGIRDEHFGGWLHGFGAYLNNFYGVGDFHIRNTGESVSTTFDIQNGLLHSKMSEVVYDLTGDKNYLRNAEFTDLNADGTIRDWTITGNDIQFYSVGGEVTVSSVGTMGAVGNCVRTEIVDGTMALHIANGKIQQSHTLMKQPGTHKEYNAGDSTSSENGYTTKNNVLHMSIRIKVIKQGTLTIGFPGSAMTEATAMKAKMRVLERDTDWKILEWEGTWDGQSDFVLQFSGECYVSMLAITDDELSDLKTEYSTSWVQTSRNITFEASRINQQTTQIAQFDIRASQIEATVSENYTDLNGRVSSNSANITLTASQIRSEVNSSVTTLDGKITEAQSSITQTASAIRSEVSASVTALSGRIDTANNDITSLSSRIDQTAQSITGSVSALQDKTRNLMDWNDWEYGSFSNGTKVDNSNCIRTKTPIAINGSISFSMDNNHLLMVVFLNPGKQHISSTSFTPPSYGKVKVSVPNSASFVHCVVSKNPASAMGSINNEVHDAKLTLIDTTTVTSGEMSVFIDNFGESNAAIKADKIDFTFTKYTAWSAKSGSTTNTVMTLDPQGNLNIKGRLTQGYIDPGVTMNSQNIDASVMGFKASSYVLSQASTSLYTAFLHVIKRTTYNGKKTVALPTLGQCRTMIGLAQTDKREFCFQLVIANQSTSESEAEYQSTDPNNVYISGGTHAYYRTTNTLDIRPRILRQTTSSSEFNLQRGRVAIFYIAYSKWVTPNQQGYADADGTFIANYIEG